MTKDNIAISVKNVSKEFKLPHEKVGSIKGIFVNMFRGKRNYERQQVLKDVSFNIKKGEFFGIVGRNGSGKSTLLKMLAGIYEPTSGSININGKLTPFIELGVGFNPDLTGRENVYLNGALLGFTRSEMESMYDEIVEFAELERFMDQKLKNYSSGMQVRLAFSIAIRADTEILVLDEVLAVGDANFQKKCYEYFVKLKDDNKTVILVTHDMSAVENFCTRSMMIEGGKLVKIGSPSSIASLYKRLNQDNKSGAKEDDSKRWGSGEVVIGNISLTTSSGKSDRMPEINEKSKLAIAIQLSSSLARQKVVVGLAFYNSFGVNISGPNSKNITAFSDSIIKYTIEKHSLPPGTYRVVAVVFDENIINEYDHLENALQFDVSSDQKSEQHGLVNLFGEWSVK